MMAPPVGRMPTLARIYLSVVLMLILVLVTLHFYLQVWSQEQAKQWISQWEEANHAHVGHVRFRMLRGALTLEDVRWQSPDLRLSLPFVLLRGNVSDRLEAVQIRDVTLHQASLQVSQRLLRQLRHHPEQVMTLLPWDAMFKELRHVSSDGMSVSVQENLKVTSRVQAAFVQGSCEADVQQNFWRCESQMKGGGEWNMTSHAESVTLNWLNMKGQTLLPLFDFTAMSGELSGQMHWQDGALSGQTAWFSPANGKQQRQGKMAWHGEPLAQGGWRMDLHLDEFPIGFLSQYLPPVGGQSCTSGFAQAAVHITGDDEGWQTVQSDEVKLTELVLQEHGMLQSAQLQGLLWDRSARHFSVEHSDVWGGRWLLAAPDATASGWQMHLPDIQWHDMRIGVQMGELWLGGVQGHGSWQDKQWQLNFSSHDGLEGEWQWQLEQTLDAPNVVGISIQAKQAPILMFRTLLPPRLEQGAGVRGTVDLNLMGEWSTKGWQLQGELQGHDLFWNRNVWLWQVGSLEMKGLRLSSQHAPHMASLTLNQWHGQASLSPWLQVEPVGAVAPRLPNFWLADWDVDALHLGAGHFSLGQAEQVWLELETMQLAPIHVGKAIEMNLHGTLAEGELQWRGEWFPWGESPWLSVRASLHDALPFVASDWLHLSGLPSFTQGRISAALELDPLAQKPSFYVGELAIQLQHARLQQGVVSNQSFEAVTGYSPHALLDRFAHQGSMEIRESFEGGGLKNPLSGGVLGEVLLRGLRASVNEAPSATMPVVHKPTVLSQIRLHDSKGAKVDHLKHNERVRLRKVMRVLQKNPSWHVVLVPQLGRGVLSASLVRRIRETQQQIETFLVERGVEASRIVPALAEETQRSGEVTGISIQVSE